ncbi:MAG: hypothetical protein GTO03_03575 [Planctomycetales bacterium]|nr:hypothetical protein [Planctomycetales bacterium]
MLRTLVAGFVLGCCLTLAIRAGGPASAGERSAVQIESVTLGFAGIYKLGSWTPVHVTLAATGRPEGLKIAVTAPDNDAVAARVEQEVDLQPNSVDDAGNVHVVTYARVGRVSGTLVVEVLAAGQVLDRRTLDLTQHRGLPSADFLLVTVGELPHVADAVVRHPATREVNMTVAAVQDAARLPQQWFGYEGVDAVILSGRLALEQGLSSAAKTAVTRGLVAWVHSGGQLILSVDQEAQQLMAADSPLAELLPGPIAKMVKVPPLHSLEAYSGSQGPLLFEDEIGRPLAIRGPRLAEVAGEIVLYEGRGPADFPVLVNSAFGFGNVSFLAIDLARPQFGRWDGTERLIARLLLGDRAEQSLRDVELPGELAHLGYDDLAAQLRAALDQFDAQGVRLIPFEVFFLVCLVYILVLAPGDYFLLRRWARRMEWTWLTFPLLILAGSVGVYFLAAWAKGDQLRLNQISLIDIDLKDGRYRGTSWFTLFSPRTDVYDLSLQARLPASETLAARPSAVSAWLGLPGAALGGMQSLAAAPQVDAAYRMVLERGEVESLPIQIWSTRALVGRMRGATAARIEPDLRVSSGAGDDLLVGTVRNVTDVDLYDCALFYKRWVYLLDTVEAGQQAVVTDDLNMNIRTVQSYLTRLGDWTTESDAQRSDLSRIVQRMMFYDAAGGLQYTPLKNQYQSFVDMSGLLAAGKAVFVGRAAQAALVVTQPKTNLSNLPDRPQTFYRFVFSIDATPRGG